jgi:hypothetical protein
VSQLGQQDCLPVLEPVMPSIVARVEAVRDHPEKPPDAHGMQSLEAMFSKRRAAIFPDLDLRS